MDKQKLLVALVFSLFMVSLARFNVPTVKAGSVTVGTSTTNTAVYPSFLRKGFYANGRYWVFYSDGSNIVYRTSIDGASWTDAITIVAGTSGRFISVCFDGVYMHYAYASTTCESYGYYRKGTPNSDGTITWVSSQQIAIQNATDTSIYYPNIAVDSEGYPFIGYKTEKTGYHYPYVTKSSVNDGSWTTASGFPLKLNTTFAYWGVVVVPLLSSKMYVVYGYNDGSLSGRLYNGTGFESVESPIGSLVLTTPPDMPLFSVVAINNDVYVAFTEKTSYDIHFVKRTYDSGWGSIENIQLSTTQTSAPVLTIVGDDILCFWMGSPTANHIYYKSRINGTWDTNPTDYQNESSDTIGNNRRITSFYQDHNRHVGLLYLTKSGSPYNVKFALSIFRSYTFHGLFDESTGLLKGASERAVDVTAYYLDETSSTFEVNGTYIFTTSELPLYFHFELGTNDREYWISSTEYVETIYIFNATLTTYTISFLDLAGVLDDNPFVEAQRLINGTLMTVEKRKVDVENKITMSLVNGVKYNIIIQDGSSYTFGDLLMTSTTTVQLTLKGIAFPKETLLTYKYVHIYATRVFDTPNGTITITYQDLLNMTASVKIYIKYKNGTTVYTATETTNSFNHEWANALNNTDYRVVCTIDHGRYGVYSWKQYFPQHLSSMPWGLDWLGKSLPFNTAYIIPAFLIFFVGGCFSAINAEVGAFMMVIVAIIIAYMGWLPIPGTALVTALSFAVIMGIIYMKRKVQT